MGEPDFLPRLRAISTYPAARGLADDAAVLGDLVLTHDMIVEGVHFLPDERPQDVAWKLAAVTLSDLAAKGAAPLGVLVGYSLTGDERSEEHTSELQSLMRISYAVFCLNKKITPTTEFY